LFGHYECTTSVESTSNNSQRVIHRYLEAIDDNTAAEAAEQVMERHSDATPRPLFSRVLCAPPSSTPVERVLFQSGLILSE